jgi:hypothetical protein
MALTPQLRGLFSEKVQLDLQAADLFVKRRRGRLNRRLLARLARREQLRQLLEQLPLPLADLRRVNLILLRKLAGRLLALRRLKRHTGLEVRTESFTFASGHVDGSSRLGRG